MDLITKDQVLEKITYIKNDACSDAGCHEEEDALYLAILQRVAAEGEGELQEIAQLALETQTFGFCRWCS